MKRESPFGFYRYAVEFKEGAEKIQSPNPTHPLGHHGLTTAYYMLGHSIELFLKAFLLGRGEEIFLLSSKTFGHDLNKLLEESRRRRLGTLVILNRNETLTISLLNQRYKKKEFEYFAFGFKQLPSYPELFKTAHKFEVGLKSFVEKKTKELRRRESKQDRGGSG